MLSTVVIDHFQIIVAALLGGLSYSIKTYRVWLGVRPTFNTNIEAFENICHNCHLRVNAQMHSKWLPRKMPINPKRRWTWLNIQPWCLLPLLSPFKRSWIISFGNLKYKANNNQCFRGLLNIDWEAWSSFCCFFPPRSHLPVVFTLGQVLGDTYESQWPASLP